MSVPDVIAKAVDPTHANFEKLSETKTRNKNDASEYKSTISAQPIRQLGTIQIDDYGIDFETFETEKHVLDLNESDESDEEISQPEDNVGVIFTIKQLKEIITMTINSGTIGKKIEKCCENDIQFTELFENYRDKLNELNRNCRDVLRKVQKDMTTTNEHLSIAQQNTMTTRDDLNRMIHSNSEKIAKLNTHSKEMDDFKKDNTTK